jgi:orotidine-5'-phosphate decarboxylase
VQATGFSVGNRLIAALDTPSRVEAESFIERLGGVPDWYKVGLELFCAEGPSLVTRFANQGIRVMLDLKLHDIPETVGRATQRVADLGAELLTVHSEGGKEMLEKAVKAKGTMRILAITVLTSLDQGDLEQIGVKDFAVSDLVRKRAELALAAGCDGVVASPQEVAVIRTLNPPPGFLIVTPGVRPAERPTDDQKRVTTPKQARLAGADMVVVGRPLRDARDPAQAARKIVEDLA